MCAFRRMRVCERGRGGGKRGGGGGSGAVRLLQFLWVSLTGFSVLSVDVPCIRQLGLVKFGGAAVRAYE